MVVLHEAIERKDLKLVRHIVQKIPIANIANELEKLSTEKQLIFFRMLETKIAAKIFSSLQASVQKNLVVAFTSDETVKIFDELYSDEAADLLEEIPANIAKMILEKTSKEKRAIANRLLHYKEDEVGSIMNVEITTLKQNWSCKQALAEIKKFRQSREISGFYFVKNAKGFLVGAINIEDLIFSTPSSSINKLLISVQPLVTHDNIEDAGFVFREQDMGTLPVVNSEHILVGMVTADDILDVVEEEATEDIHKMAGIEPIEDPYFATTIRQLVRSRIFWLLFLMISATISQIVLDVFIGITDKYFPGKGESGPVISATISTMLVTIIPVISGAAGNAGSQSSTMITRALAVKEVFLKDYYRILWREFQIGIMAGSMLGAANFLRLIIYYLVGGEFDVTAIWISFGASISLIVVITIAKLVGGLLPLIAKLLNQDPAVMAAPLISTLTDALSSVLFFSINIAILLLVLPHT